MTVENRRGFYRIPYPADARPRLLVDAPGPARLVYEVLECSERGLSFQPSAETGDVGEALEGRIRFPRGVDLPIHGEVVRVLPDRVSVSLQGSGIPFAVIFQEQLHLRKQR